MMLKLINVNSPNKYSWTFIGAIPSHSVMFKWHLGKFWYVILTVLLISDKVGNFGQFDNKTLFGNDSDLHTKIEFSLTELTV